MHLLLVFFALKGFETNPFGNQLDPNKVVSYAS
jgi:hypothetical protein